MAPLDLSGPLSGAAGCRHLAHDPVEHRHLLAAADATVPQPVDQDGSAFGIAATSRRPCWIATMESSSLCHTATGWQTSADSKPQGRSIASPSSSHPSRPGRIASWIASSTYAGDRPLLRRGRRRVITERAHEPVHVSAPQVFDLGVVEARQRLSPLRRRPQRLLPGQLQLLGVHAGAVDLLVRHARVLLSLRAIGASTTER